LDNPDPAGRVVHPDPRFRIFFTSNVAGTGDDMDLYAQTKLQDTSLLSRVDIRVIRDYPSRDEEFRALKNAYPDKVSKYEGKVMKLIQLANLLRTSFKQKNLPTVFSTRQVYTALCLMEHITSIKTVIDMVYSNDLKAQAERELVLTSMNSVGF
jgi:MoxR-like ATPase